VDLVTIDVSFISLKLVVPPAVSWLQEGGQLVALVKPQFEAGRKLVGKGGVVRDPDVHRAVLADLAHWAHNQDLGLEGLIRSPITGPAGNVEFLAHWVPGGSPATDIETLIEVCLLTESEGLHA
ncbi:MAG: TlyA family rRNA (cytidine-2'-O)-methyltransferase, partial [Anaerolineae bacterium]